MWLWKLPKLTWLALAGNDESGLCLHSSSGDDSGSSSGGGSGDDSSGSGSGGKDDGIPAVSWSDLLIQEKLGEGASGVIYKASWSSSSSSSGIAQAVFPTTDNIIDGMVIGVEVGVGQEVEQGLVPRPRVEQRVCSERDPLVVAVKLFKGGKTSDGLPEDEMKAAQAAGGHPCSFQGGL